MPELPAATSKHPARRAAFRSMDAVARGDRSAWLANFAEDAHVEDPVGKSVIDPSGAGFRGKSEIGKFWDTFIANARPMFRLQSSIACGNECANIGTLMTQFPNGVVASVYGVFVYRVNEAGQVSSLRTYWEAEEMEQFPAFEERGK